MSVRQVGKQCLMHASTLAGQRSVLAMQVSRHTEHFTGASCERAGTDTRKSRQSDRKVIRPFDAIVKLTVSASRDGMSVYTWQVFVKRQAIC
jgi:hypothetical protein